MISNHAIAHLVLSLAAFCGVYLMYRPYRGAERQQYHRVKSANTHDREGNADGR